MAQVLPRRRNHNFPYNPFTNRGRRSDSAMYLLEPGENFIRPWIRVPGGEAYVWPVGIEGFNDNIEPTLGIHRYIGDNAVEVDVIHLGEERIRLSGSFPGDTSVSHFRSLRDIVYKRTPKTGKILYLPYLMSHAQRVAIASASFDHPEDQIGDMSLHYEIEFVRIGIGAKVGAARTREPVRQPTPGKKRKGKSPRVFTANGTYNTLRKIAAKKLGSPNKWRSLYEKNGDWFFKRRIAAFQAPNYRLPPGTKIRF